MRRLKRLRVRGDPAEFGAAGRPFLTMRVGTMPAKSTF